MIKEYSLASAIDSNKAPGFLSWVSHRRLWVTLLMGMSSGLPLALVGSTLQAWYTEAGVNVIAIGSLSLVGQPYVYKFLWARFLDLYQLPGLGLRRGWIFAMQLLLATVFAVMALLNPISSPVLLGILALVAASLSATQDIAVDAYRTDLLPKEEHGIGAALYTSGYRLAALFSGGIALVIAASVGFKATYIIMAIGMVIGSIATLWAPRLNPVPQEAMGFMQLIVAPFKEFMSRKSIGLLLLFVVFYKIGDAFALQLTTTFLLRGLGFNLVDVGMIYKTMGLIGTIVGLVIAGTIMTRIRLYTALWIFGILQGLSIFFFVILALVGKSYSLMMFTIFMEYFCSGLGTAAFLALLMGMCDHRYTATQFALLSALAAIGRVFIGPLAGLIVAYWGWVPYYCCGVALAVPGLILLWLVRERL
ncbi:MAG: MFS transporter [Gammaproteobacteria bacterium]|nr:MFS transporter [Gammaproteobacteria bacterium]